MNGHVEIEVKDDGAGISQANLDRIFEPFYTKKPDGTGLGLYISKQLIEKNGAKIRAVPSPGQGATFRITF